jgi:hypothetical protein
VVFALVSFLVSFAFDRCFRGLVSAFGLLPKVATDLICDRAPDGRGHVLVPAGHAGTRPAHHPHGGAVVHPQFQQDRGGRVAGIVLAGVPYAGVAEETLPMELISPCVELPSQLVGEDPAVVVPEITCLRSLGLLFLPVPFEFDDQRCR